MNKDCIAERYIPENLGKIKDHYLSDKGKHLVIITELQHKRMGIFGKKTHFIYVWNIPEDTFKYYGNFSTISRPSGSGLIQFFSDDEFVFSNGKMLTIYNLSNNSKQELGKLSPTFIEVSPNKQRMVCATNKDGNMRFDFYDLPLRKLIGSKKFNRSIRCVSLDNNTLYFGFENFNSYIYYLRLEDLKFGDKPTFIKSNELAFIKSADKKTRIDSDGLYLSFNDITKYTIKINNKYKAILTDDMARTPYYYVLILDENNNLILKWNTLNLVNLKDSYQLKFKANKLLFICNNQINFLTFPLLTYKELKEKTETIENNQKVSISRLK